MKRHEHTTEQLPPHKVSKPGLEMVDDQLAGRDPRRMTEAEFAELGHQRMSPMGVIRAKCLDCAAGSAPEVRLCVSTSCVSWPYRMGKNPFRAPVSDAQREARRERAKDFAARVRNPAGGMGSGATGGVAATHLPAAAD
jgi:hypothetical protein